MILRICTGNIHVFASVIYKGFNRFFSLAVYRNCIGFLKSVHGPLCGAQIRPHLDGSYVLQALNTIWGCGYAGNLRPNCGLRRHTNWWEQCQAIIANGYWKRFNGTDSVFAGIYTEGSWKVKDFLSVYFYFYFCSIIK